MQQVYSKKILVLLYLPAPILSLNRSGARSNIGTIFNVPYLKTNIGLIYTISTNILAVLCYLYETSA